MDQLVVSDVGWFVEPRILWSVGWLIDLEVQLVGWKVEPLSGLGSG